MTSPKVDRASSACSKPPPASNPQLQVANEKPPLQTLISTHDFETVASKTLTPKTWAFYSSAATDLVTAKANESFFDRIWWRPRVLTDVRKVDTTVKIQGVESRLPFFVSPAALAKLVHGDGEKGLAGACKTKGIIQCVCSPEPVYVETTTTSAGWSSGMTAKALWGLYHRSPRMHPFPSTRSSPPLPPIPSFFNSM